jgi:hypothetical protein
MSTSAHRWIVALTIAAGLVASELNAGTIAYWRMEGDGVTTPSDGTFVQDTNGRSAIQTTGIPIIDVSGNGNTVYTWDDNSTGHQYRPDTPAAVLPNGTPNDWSIQNNGGFPASFTWSAQTSPGGTDVETITPSSWTIEASVKATTVDGAFHTFVGREGNGVTGLNAGLAPLYFGMTNTNQFAIKFADAAGNFHELLDTETVVADQWYNLAAVSDGSTLRLYKDEIDGNGYLEVGSLDISGSANSAMADPGLDQNGDTWGWTLGRGRFGTSDNPTANHVDRWLGFIDEVRISDMALAPGNFLFAPVPEPGTLVLVALGVVAAIPRRRRVR